MKEVRFFRAKHMTMKNNTKGMTLMEVLVSVFVLAIFSVGVLTSLRASISVVDTTDTIIHFEEVRNNTLEKFQMNPSVKDLGTIMPIDHVEIDENTYDVYYDDNLKAVGTPEEAEYRIRFQRTSVEGELDEFNVASSEVTLKTTIYNKGEATEGGLGEDGFFNDTLWDVYQPTMVSGTTGVGVLGVGVSPGIPGGEDTKIGKVIIEAVNATIHYQGSAVGTRYELTGVVPGEMLGDYMSGFTFIPDDDADLNTEKIEVRSEIVEGGWEAIPDFNIPAGFETTIRVSYDEWKELNLTFQVPATLSSTGTLTKGTIDTVPFLGDKTELTDGSITQLLGEQSYENLFSDVTGYDHTDVIWVDEMSGLEITYDELLEGVTLYTPDTANTARPVIDRTKFMNKTLSATFPGIGTGGYHLNIRAIGFDNHAFLQPGTRDYIIPHVKPGEKATIAQISTAMFGAGTPYSNDFRTVANASAAIVEYPNGFGDGTTQSVSWEMSSGGLTMDRTRYLEVRYQPVTSLIHVYTRIENGASNLAGKMTIRRDYDNILTANRISNAIGRNIESYYGSDYVLEGAFIGGESRLNTAVRTTDNNKTMFLEYEKSDNPMHLNIKIDAAEFGEQALTDATISNISFEKKLFWGSIETGTEVQIVETARVLQTTPNVTTVTKTHNADFQYSINNGAYQTPGKAAEWAPIIAAEYAKEDYTGILVNFYVDYPYADVKSIATGNVTLNAANGNVISDAVISDIFKGQGATFRPENGVTTEIDDTGKIVYYGTGADANLVALLGLDLEYKFRSLATPIVETDVHVDQYVKNVTLLWDVSGMDSVARLNDQATQMGGSVGLIPLGSNKYQFSYQQNGQELMKGDRIVTIPNLTALDNLTLVIYRNNPGLSAFNYYGAWRPLITAHGGTTKQTTGQSGNDWNNVYNTKYIHKDVALSPNSIPINNVELVHGAAWVVGSVDQSFQPDSIISHPAILSKRDGGSLKSDRADKLIYSRGDFPSGQVAFTTVSGYQQKGYETGWLLGETHSAANQSTIVSVPFSYTDLAVSVISNIQLSGGLVFGIR